MRKITLFQIQVVCVVVICSSQKEETVTRFIFMVHLPLSAPCYLQALSTVFFQASFFFYFLFN